MVKVSFEEACKIAGKVVTPESLQTLGVEKTMALYAEELAKTGWTHGELMDEARVRMLARIEKLKQEENK